MDSGGPKERRIGWCPDPACDRERVLLRGKGTAHCKVLGRSAVSCANTAEPIEIPFGVLSGVGPGKHVIDHGMHIVAIWRIRLNRLCASATRPYVKLL